jgi:hypothetical protein
MAEHPHHTPGEFPEVRDEAQPTPSWVPLLGLGLLGVIALFVVYRAANPSEETEAEGVAGEIGATPAEEAAGGEGDTAGAAQPEGAPTMPQIVPVPTDRIAPAQLAQPAQPAQPAAQPAQPAAPGGGPDAFGRMPGEEHYGHGHE